VPLSSQGHGTTHEMDGIEASRAATEIKDVAPSGQPGVRQEGFRELTMIDVRELLRRRQAGEERAAPTARR